MTVIFHVGTHKTATTSFQRYLASNRLQLEQAKYCYPQYSQLINTHISHYAHIDLARAVDPAIASRFSRDEAAHMFESMNQLSQQGVTVLASGEPLWRIGFSSLNNESIYAAKNALIKPIWSLLSNSYVFITLRLLPDFMLSMYSEHILQTGYCDDVNTFAKRYYYLFDYHESIKYWAQISPVRLCCYEESLQAPHLGNYMLSCMLGSPGIPLKKYKKMPRANLSLPFPLLVYKRHLNSFYHDPNTAKTLVKTLWNCPLVKNDPAITKYFHYSWFDSDQWFRLLKLNQHDWLFNHYSSHDCSSQSSRILGYLSSIAKARSLRAPKKEDLARIIGCLDSHSRRLSPALFVPTPTG